MDHRHLRAHTEETVQVRDLYTSALEEGRSDAPVLLHNLARQAV